MMRCLRADVENKKALQLSDILIITRLLSVVCTGIEPVLPE